jgi:CRP-like cAMP-binding protein
MSNKKIFSKLVRSYPTGNIIFNEGDTWDGLYCVQIGKVSVFKTQKGKEGHKIVELAQLGPGSLIGEMGLFEKTKRDASVKAIEYTEMLIISREMFDEQMTRVPPWMVNLFKILTQRLRVTNERLMAVTHNQGTVPVVDAAQTIRDDAVIQAASEAISLAKASGPLEKAGAMKVPENPFDNLA